MRAVRPFATSLRQHVPAVVPLVSILIVLTAAACGRSGPRITAHPNPVPDGDNPGKTTISWTTGDDRRGVVYVARNGSGEQLFATGREGSQEAAWIAAGSRYEFRLYTDEPSRALLATVEVRQRDDQGIAVNAALIVAVLVGLLVLLRVPWAIEVAPIALLVTGLWVKFVHLSVQFAGAQMPRDRHVLGATLAGLLLPYSVLLLFGWTARTALAIALSLGLTTLALADLLHFRFYNDVTSIAELSHASQLVDVASSVAALFRPEDLLYYLDVAIVLGLWPLLARYRDEAPMRGGWLLSAVLVVLSGLLVAQPLQLARLDPRGVFEFATRRADVVSTVGLLPYHYFDGFVHARYTLAGRLQTTEADRQRAFRYLDGRRWTAGTPTDLAGIARGRNVILVMAESLQAFPATLVIGGQPVMPRLSALMRESLTFDNFFDQAHLGTTSDGEFMALQSLHPVPTGAVATRYPGQRYRALPTILREHGYATLSAAGDPGHIWNKLQMHPQLGFERSLFVESLDQTEMFGLGLSDGELFRQSLSLLDAQPEPFMAFLTSVSNHYPYDSLPARHRLLKVGELEGTLVGNYLQTVHYFDRALGAFVDGLRASGLLDRSILVVYGDHTAFLRDAPEIGRLLSLPTWTRHDQWRVRKRLPLVIRLPDGHPAGSMPGAAGHLDIAPTILGLLGITDDSAVMLGRDLTRTTEPLVVFREGGFTTGAHDLIDGAVDSGRTACYESGTGVEVDCRLLDDARWAAEEELEISSTILEGDLVPYLAGRLSSTSSPEQGLARAPLAGMHVIAHRGNSVEAPENTLAAIREALDLGCEMVEVDVHLSRDRVPVVIHDDTVDRTTNGRGAVARMTVDDLKALDAGSWKGARYAGERIPTLVEALEVARGRGRLLLDLKAGGLGAPVAAALSRLGLSPASIVVGTWTPDQAADMVRHLPGALILASDGWTGAPAAWDDRFFEDARARGIGGFELGTNWSPAFVADAHDHGMPVFAFTINDESAMRRLVRIGIDGIETDRPALLAEVVSQLNVARAGPRANGPAVDTTEGARSR